MYGIYVRPWGFEVSIVRRGVRYFQQFGKASYGGAEHALRRAQEWRDSIVRSVPPVARRERAEKLRASNTTGVPGVFCLVSPDGRGLSWLAKTYIAAEEILRANFPIHSWGDAARNLAIQERAKQLKHMTGLAALHPAEEAIRKSHGAASTVSGPPKRSRSEIMRKSNSSGVTGVHFKRPRADHPGYWLAITYTAGKGSVSKAFSVKAHGYDEAKRLAAAERTRQLAQKGIG
jgi:hypothetical protein